MSDTGHDIDPRFGVPVLGTAKTGPNAPGLTASFEIYDSELVKIREVLGALDRRYGGRANYHDMHRDIIDRMRRIGFVVAVGWWMMEDVDTGQTVQGFLLPEVTIRDRVAAHEFDHDRQVHEVTRDVAGTGDAGVIKFDPSQMQGHRH